MRKTENKREARILETVFKRSLATFMLNNMTMTLASLVDGAVIGRFLGVDALAAFGLVWPLTFIYTLTGPIIAGGSRKLFTKHAAKGQLKEANQVFSFACTLAAGTALTMTLLTLVFLSPLAALLGASGDNAALHPMVCRYLSGFVLGLSFDGAARVLAAHMGIDSDHRRVITATFIMTVTDVTGDLAVVMFFEGDLFLLGLASSVGHLVYFLVLSTHFLRKQRMLRYSLKGLTDVKKTFTAMVKNGLPAGINRATSALSGIAVNRMLSATATSSFIAAYSVHKSMAALAVAVYIGVADTVWTLSGIYYGEEDRQALDALQRTAVRIGLKIALFFTVLLSLLSPLIAGFYVSQSEPEILALAAQAVRLLAFSIPLYVAVYLFDNYLTGTDKLRSAAVYSFFMECGVVIPVVFLMVSLFGGRGAWFATPVSLTLLLFAAAVYILRWKQGTTFHEKRLLLPADFGTDAGKEIRISADTVAEVMGMSRLAGLFSEENGIDKKKGCLLALCVEELGTNIIRHGFSDEKPHSIEMRMLVKKDELILRIRDDCKAFNPVEQYELIREQEDVTKNIGIRLVMRMSKDVKYMSTLKTNNLIIRL